MAQVDCFGDVEELPSDEWERVLRVNVTSAFLTAKYSVPLMRTRGGGAILNISSVSGVANQRKAMVYSVSKAALISLTKSEAIDFAQDRIRANTILPGSGASHFPARVCVCFCVSAFLRFDLSTCLAASRSASVSSHFPIQN